jgi:ribokinase
MSRWDLLAAGDIFVDLVMTGFPRWPQPGEEVFAESLAREVGGGCAITAAGAAALGLRAAVIACVGLDEAAWVTRRLIGRGVDASGLCLDEEATTALTVSVSSPEDRAFFSYQGANRGLPGLLADPTTAALLGETRHLHLACALAPAALGELARAARRSSVTVSLDVGWHEDWLRDPAALTALRELDLFFPNRREAGCLTGEEQPEAMLHWLGRAGLRRVALKLGGEGAMLLWEGALLRQAPHPVPSVDTTGAGDAFDAGFLAAWLSGAGPERCLRQAAVCGALSTRALGGLAGLARADEVAAALQGGQP